MVLYLHFNLFAQTNYTPYTFVSLAGSGTAGTNDGTGNTAQFNSPRGLGIDASGTVYVADYNNDTIRKVTSDGVVTTIAGLAGVAGTNDGAGDLAQFDQPRRVVADKLGNLFVADALNHTIRKLTPSGTNWMVTTIAGLGGVAGTNDGLGATARFNQPSGVALDNAQNIYVADNINRTLRRVVPVGTNWMVTTIAGLAGSSGSADGTNSTARFAGPINVDVDGVGNVYVADNNNNMIRKVTLVGTNWVVTTPAGSTTAGYADGMGGAAQFNNPTGVAVDSAGNIYVGDTFNDVIRKITPVGTNYVVTTLAGFAQVSGFADGTADAARFNNPRGIVADNEGNIYVADSANNAIRKGWDTNASPIIVLDMPLIINGQVQLGFRIITGTANEFQLLESDQVAGMLVTNETVMLTTNVPNIAYQFVAPLNGAVHFYKVQSNN